jgi:hypothetical protein
MLQTSQQLISWGSIAEWAQFISTVLIGILAGYIAWRQLRIQDTIELYCSLLLINSKDSEGNTISVPYIHVQNVGTRLVYLDKYIFNGREYMTDSQILPSTYSGAENSFYRIQLPINGETYVSMEVFYHDLNNRPWSSKIIANRGGLMGWEIKTLPRKSILKR